jgi:hypothetical protein
MEATNMRRLLKVLSVAGLSSVYLMQTPCTIADGGFNLLVEPDFTLANILTQLGLG